MALLVILLTPISNLLIGSYHGIYGKSSSKMRLPMNAAKQYFKTSNPVTSTPYYNLRLLNSVSPSARLLYIEMRRLSGLNGYISKSIRELSYFIGKSARQVSRLVHELESNKLIEVWAHEGFESEYIVPDVYFRHTHDKCVRTFKSKIKKELTVSRPKPDGISLEHQDSDTKVAPAGIVEQTSIHQQEVKNDFHADTIEPEHMDTAPIVTESSPKSIHNKPVKPVNFLLVKEILALTNDHKSVRCWIKFVRSAPEQIVQLAIHSLKAALQSETVYHAGRYMVGIIKRLCPNMFDSGHKVSLRQPEQFSDASYYPRAVVDEHQIEPDWNVNMEQLKLIREKLCRVG